MTDARFQFGALGAWQADKGPIEFGFRFPGTTARRRAARRSGSRTATRWMRRYHPIAPRRGPQLPGEFPLRTERVVPRRDAKRLALGVEHAEPARQLHRRRPDAPRSHRPPGVPGRHHRRAHRHSLRLSPRWTTCQWNWTMVAMGFVGKNIECADELLREGDRDKTERGQKMRQTGLAIIASLIQALPTVPLQGTGYDLTTGKPWDRRPSRVARPLAAERHRRHARADAGLPARAGLGPPASGVVQLGQAVRRLAHPATEGRRLLPAALESRKQRGRGGIRDVELLPRAAAGPHVRRDRRPEIPAVGHPRGRVRLVELGNPRSVHRRHDRQSEYHRQRGRDAQHGSLT